MANDSGLDEAKLPCAYVPRLMDEWGLLLGDQREKRAGTLNLVDAVRPLIGEWRKKAAEMREAVLKRMLDLRGKRREIEAANRRFHRIRNFTTNI